MDGTGTDESRQQLSQLMDEQRRRLRLKWTQVALVADMSTQNLREIRQGTIGITVDAADRIEDALKWSRGSIQRFLQNGTPPRTTESGVTDTPGFPEDSDLIFEGLRGLFRKHRVRMTPRMLRRLLDDIDDELQARSQHGDPPERGG